MSGSSALRKLLFAERDLGEQEHRGYHYLGSYEALLHSAWIEQPASVSPRSGFTLASFCLFSSFMSCFFMKRRNKEKWWFGLFLITGVYYSSVKAHKVNNGLVGHQSGFFAAGMGAIGSTARLVLKSGHRNANLSLLALFSSMMWYELGRFHLWSEHVVEFRRMSTPQRSYDLLNEYVSPSLHIEFLPYRSLQ